MRKSAALGSKSGRRACIIARLSDLGGGSVRRAQRRIPTREGDRHRSPSWLLRVRPPRGVALRLTALTPILVVCVALTNGAAATASRPHDPAPAPTAFAASVCRSVPSGGKGRVDNAAVQAVACKLLALRGTATTGVGSLTTLMRTCERSAVAAFNEARNLSLGSRRLATNSNQLASIIRYIDRERAWYARHGKTRSLRVGANALLVDAARDLSGAARATSALRVNLGSVASAARADRCVKAAAASASTAGAVTSAKAAAGTISTDAVRTPALLARAATNPGTFTPGTPPYDDSFTIAFGAQHGSGVAAFLADQQLGDLVEAVYVQLAQAEWAPTTTPSPTTQVGVTVVGSSAAVAFLSSAANFVQTAGEVADAVQNGATLTSDLQNINDLSEVGGLAGSASAALQVGNDLSPSAFTDLGSINASQLQGTATAVNTAQEITLQNAANSLRSVPGDTPVTDVKFYAGEGQYVSFTFPDLSIGAPRLNLDLHAILSHTFWKYANPGGYGGLPMPGQSCNDGVCVTEACLAELLQRSVALDSNGHEIPVTVSGLSTGTCSTGGGPIPPGPPPPAPPSPTTIITTSTPNVVYANHQVTYSATINGFDCNTVLSTCGTVTFTDNGTPIPECTGVDVYWYSAQTTCKVAYPAAGSHSIVAAYSGDSEYSASSAVPLPVFVQPLPTCSPSIASVGGLAAAQEQTITIRGSCLGYEEPYDGDTPFIQLAMENEKGGDAWNAGNSGTLPTSGCIVSSNGDWVTLNAPQWTENEIQISGFTGSYGAFGWVLYEGESRTRDLESARRKGAVLLHDNRRLIVPASQSTSSRSAGTRLVLSTAVAIGLVGGLTLVPLQALDAAAASPTSSVGAPVLGRPAVSGPGSGPSEKGFGQAKPSTISLGGADPTGTVSQIHWRAWGRHEAIGDGTGWYFKPNQGTSQGHYAHERVVATHLGTCHGRRAYDEMEWYFPAYEHRGSQGAFRVNVCTWHRT